MKAKFLFVTLFLAVFLIPFVAADANLNITSISFSSSVTHGSSNLVTFVLQNLNATGGNLTNVNYTITTPWDTIVTQYSYNITNSSSSLSVSIPVPQYTSAISTTGTIIARALLDGTAAANDSRTFNINVTDSPALTIAWVASPQDVYQGENTSAIVNITNAGNVDFSSVYINLTDSNATFSTSSVPLARNGSYAWTVNISTNKKTNYGSSSMTVTARGTNSTYSLNATASSTADFDVLYRYCVANRSTSRISIYEITNREDIDDEEFDALDELTIKVKVENEDDEEDRVAVVNAVLVHDYSEVDDTEVEKSVEISSDNSKTVTLNMTIPVDVEEGVYFLYIKAYDDDSSKYCDQEVIEFIIDKSSTHKVIPYELSVEPTNVSCGGLFTVKGKIGNIGSYDEDSVKLVYSDGWTTSTKTFNSFDEGETGEFEFSSAVAANATEGAKSFTLTLSYYYDDNDNEYQRTDSESFSLFSVAGNCIRESSNVSFSTETATPQVFTGTQSEVRILVSNSGTIKQNYTVEIPTASVNWALVNSISPSSFELEAGASRYVSVKLTPNANATSGLHTMDAKISYAGTSQTKTLSLNLQKVSEVSNLIDRVKFSVSRDWIWYVIGGLAAVVIVLMFAISSASKKAALLQTAASAKKIRQYKNY